MYFADFDQDFFDKTAFGWVLYSASPIYDLLNSYFMVDWCVWTIKYMDAIEPYFEEEGTILEPYHWIKYGREDPSEWAGIPKNPKKAKKAKETDESDEETIDVPPFNEKRLRQFEPFDDGLYGDEDEFSSYGDEESEDNDGEVEMKENELEEEEEGVKEIDHSKVYWGSILNIVL
jgi:hypothetical protein